MRSPRGAVMPECRRLRLENVQRGSAVALRLRKGPSSPVITLAAAPALFRPSVLRVPALRGFTAAQVGFATLAVLVNGVLLSIATPPGCGWRCAGTPGRRC